MDNGIDFNNAKEAVRKTAEMILNHPETISLNNYQDAFDIVQKGCPEKFTDDFKREVIERLGIAEAIVNNSNEITLENYGEKLEILALVYPPDFVKDFRDRVLKQLGI